MNKKVKVLHVCFSDGFAGVERYISNAIDFNNSDDYMFRVIGNKKLEGKYNRSWILKFGTIGRLTYALLWKPQVIHTHMTRGEFFGFIVAKLIRAQIVTTRHFALLRGSTYISRLFSAYFNKSDGTVVATYDSGSIRSVVKSTAICVTEGNWKELARQVLITWNDKRAMAGIIEKGYDNSENYTWNNIAELQANLYESQMRLQTDIPNNYEPVKRKFISRLRSVKTLSPIGRLETKIRIIRKEL